MIILDTNVLSELMKPEPSEQVIRWFRGKRASELMTTAVTQAEMFYGLAIMPAGKRRNTVAAGLEILFRQKFAGRMLKFDEQAAIHFGEVMAMRKKIGQKINVMDGLIASIARAHTAVVATRNVLHFEHCGIDVLNPWSE